MNTAWADLPAHHAVNLRGGDRPATTMPEPYLLGGRKNTAGRPAWVAAACPMPPFIWYSQCRTGCIPFRPVLTPGCTARNRIFTHQRKDCNMNDEKKIGFSVELNNGMVDLWAHGDDETLVDLAIETTANIVAAACNNNAEEAKSKMQDVKIALDVALARALEHPTKEINPEDLKAIGPADLPAKPLDKA